MSAVITIGDEEWEIADLDEGGGATHVACGTFVGFGDAARDNHVCPPPDCEPCHGTGEVGVERGWSGKWETEKCGTCDGTGEVQP